MADFASLDETTQLGVDKIATSPVALALYRNLLAAAEGKALDTGRYGWGLVKLAGGSVSSAATLDIVMTSYTGFANKLLMLRNFTPATNNTGLYLRTSTDGGSSYDAGGTDYVYVVNYADNTPTVSATGSTAAAQMSLNVTGASNTASTGGINGSIRMFGTEDTGSNFFADWDLSNLNSGGTFLTRNNGTGVRAASANVDAIRLLFSSGNIASGNWELYGFN